MKKIFYILAITGFMTISLPTYAQEEESAAISLEENNDEFQEHFFEALKQRGIENYDRAVDELLKCKEIDDNASVAFELGKNYYSLKQYEKAKEAFEDAVIKKPQNQWFLRGLFNAQLQTNEQAEAIETGKKIILLDPNFKEEVAKVYANMREYKKALTLLNELERESSGLTLSAASIKLIVMRQLDLRDTPSEEVDEVIKQTPQPTESAEDKIMLQVQEALQNNAFSEAQKLATIGLNDFPSQPKLYLFNAQALHALKKHKEAIEMLEIGLDYIIDDNILEKQFYQTFVKAYQKIGNAKKENYYRKKIQ